MDFPALPSPPPPHFLGTVDDGQRELQMELRTIMEEVEVKELAQGKRGNYTAERFEEKEPHRYKLIVTGLAKGESKQRLAVAFGVAWETVRAIERKEMGKSILEQKKAFADGLEDVIELAIDGLREKAKAHKLSSLDTGILLDKFLTLRGEASSIIETRGEDPAVAAYREFMRQMGLQAADAFAKGPAARVVEGVVVEIEGAGGLKPPAHSVQPVEDER